MRLLQRARRQSVRRQKSNRLFQACVIDALEPRRLLSGEGVQTPIAPILATTSNPTNDSVTLDQHFFDSNLPGTLVTFSTTFGQIQVGLTDAATPNTVANFLSYVDSGAYNGTIFHRSVDLTNNNGGSPSDPGTIIQGGGYAIMNSSIGHIATNAPVNDEYQSELFGDVAGTIAMAKTSYANSATSEFYFNVTDNTELDTPTTDPNGVTTSYTVFGEVLGSSSQNVINTIAALPTDSVDPSQGLTDVPVTGLSVSQVSQGVAVTGNNLVFVDSVTAEAGTAYTATSDNKALVAPTITDGVLSFSYGAGMSGTADIAVVATNLDGTSATANFTVTVPNAATPSAGPVATPVTAPYVVNGQSGSFSVLGNDTDSVAALDPSTVSIVTAPAHGTATVNTDNGFITYNPNAGYIGPDTLTYTVADTNGTVSAPAVVTLDSVPPPLAVSIGGPKQPTSLTFTQPDGITGHLSVHGGSAVVTFSSFQPTVKPVGATLFASGPGTTITNITITDNKRQYASLKVTSNGPVSLGSIDNAGGGGMTSITAPDGTISGASSLGATQVITVAALFDATLDIGSGFFTSLHIPTVTDSSVTANILGTIDSKQWLNTDGGTYNISATSITALVVPGTFDENLALTGKGYGLFLGTIGTATGSWGLSGSIFKLTMGTPGPNWELDSNGFLSTLEIKGNLANQITAAAIGKITVAGTTTGATIQTDATYSKKFLQIAHIGFGGAVTGTVVFSSGNIGTITAPSLTNSRIYAGVNITVAENGGLAASASDIAADAKITSITLGRGADAFSNALITADIIGSLNLGHVDTTATGTLEGISAHAINTFSSILVPGGVFNAGKAQLKSAAALAAWEAKLKIDLGAFELNLF